MSLGVTYKDTDPDRQSLFFAYFSILTFWTYAKYNINYMCHRLYVRFQNNICLSPDISL